MQREATQVFVMCSEFEKPINRTHSLAPGFDANTVISSQFVERQDRLVICRKKFVN
jgi:hypothetical protein